MQEKKDTGLKVGLVLFILISICLSGYLVYDKVLSKNDNTNDNKVKEVQDKKEEYESVSIEDEQVTVAFNYLDVNYFDQQELIKKFYNNKSFSINDLTNEEKMQYVLSAYDYEIGVKACTDINDSTTVSEHTLKRYLKDSSFIEEAKTKSHLLKLNSYDYDYKAGKFLVYMPACDGGTGPQDYTDVQLISAKKNSNELILTVKFIFNTFKDVTNDDKYLFTTHKTLDKNSPVVEEYIASEDNKYDLDKYSTYDVTFDIEGTNLYLNSIKMQ